ncbi:hypothetical protein AVEN_160391-1, partial [Araneus ventricosus]
ELSDDRNGRASWKYPRNLESSRCHLQALATIQDDGNVSRCYSTVAPELQAARTGIWQLLPKKQTDSIRPVSSALFSYRYDSFKEDRTDARAHRLIPRSLS